MRVPVPVVAVMVVLVVAWVIAVSLATPELPEDFDYHGDGISEARATKFRELEAQLDAVASRFGAGYVGPSGWVDRCEVGHHDLTRHDKYAYVCRIEIVRIMPVQKPFIANASRLGEALLEGDCPNGTDTDRALADLSSGPLKGSSGDCTPGYYDPAPLISGWLPADQSRNELKGGKYDLPLTCYPWYEPGLCEEELLDLAAAVAAAPPGTHSLAIVTAGEVESYHKERWVRPWLP